MGVIGEVKERDGEVWNPNYYIYKPDKRIGYKLLLGLVYSFPGGLLGGPPLKMVSMRPAFINQF
jgi:hypothetical protein